MLFKLLNQSSYNILYLYVKYLISKLKYYGFDNTALNLLRSYVEKRMQYVQIGETESEKLPTEIGVPQGSIL